MKTLVKIATASLVLSTPVLAQAGQFTPVTTESPKLVCKRIAETGSLVKKTKVCLTREQWSRSAENYSKYAEELQDGLRTRPCGEC
jgi:hypothetical protein